MLEKINGYKSYLIFGFMVLLGAVKLFTEIPEVESITMLGITNAGTLISTGLLGISGRSALKKLES